MGNNLLITFGWLSLLLLIGTFLRYKIPFFQKLLVPSAALGGILGLILINIGIINISASQLQSIVSQLFILSFISIGLTGTASHSGGKNKKTSKDITKGVIWFALAWGLVVNLQALIGVGTIKGLHLFGNSTEPMYGILLPFGFSMGTGQALTYGSLAQDQFGYANAASIALTFGVVGYLLAVFVGIPIANWGIRKGLSRKTGVLSDSLFKGVIPESQRESAGYLSFHSSNLETFAFHFAIMGIVYLFSYYTAEWLSPVLPANVASFVTGSLYMFGVFWGLIFSSGMKKMKISHLLSPDLQKSFTGWIVDFMIIASFMSIKISTIKGYVLPVVSVLFIGAILTFLICFYLGQRMGSKYDFERSMAFYGLVNGQVPNSLLLLRVVDPRYSTPPVLELAIYNAIFPVTISQIFLAIAPLLWGWSIGQSMLFFTGFIIFYVILLKVFRIFGAKTYSLFGTKTHRATSTIENEKMENLK